MSNLTQQEREWCEGKPKRKKPRKRTVYVLTGSHEYESTTVLGVYSTRRRAVTARGTHKRFYDFYTIDAVVVDV